MKKLGLHYCNLSTSELLLGACAAAGIFLGHPNPLVYIPLAGLLTPFSLFLLSVTSRSIKQAFFRGWIATTCGLSAALYWLYLPITTMAELPLLLAIPCLLLLGAYLACYYGIATACMLGLRQALGLQPTYSISFLLFAFGAGLIYGACEFLSGVLFTGFPWLSLATGFSFWPSWIQAASLIGNNGLSAWLACTACLAAAGMLIPPKKRIIPCILAGVFLGIIPLYGMCRLATSSALIDEPPVVIGMVQGNIDQSQKWDPAFQHSTTVRYLDLSRQLVQQNKKEAPFRQIDIIIWPETAMPFYFDTSPAYVSMLRSFAKEENLSLGFGTLGYKHDTKGILHFYNRFQTIRETGAIGSFYDKVHLVPFGEYIPLSLNIPFLVNLLQGTGFTPGSEVKPIQLSVKDPLADAQPPRLEKEIVSSPILPPYHFAENRVYLTRTEKVGVLICYEAIFPDLSRLQVANGASLLINVSNDAWFGKSSAPSQHLGLAVMRAVEQNRPMIRSTNTGYSAVIDAYGRIILSGALFKDETFVAEVLPRRELTFYFHAAPWIDAVLYTVFGGSWLFIFFRKHKKTQQNKATA